MDAAQELANIWWRAPYSVLFGAQERLRDLHYSGTGLDSDKMVAISMMKDIVLLMYLFTFYIFTSTMTIRLFRFGVPEGYLAIPAVL